MVVRIRAGATLSGLKWSIKGRFFFEIGDIMKHHRRYRSTRNGNGHRHFTRPKEQALAEGAEIGAGLEFGVIVAAYQNGVLVRSLRNNDEVWLGSQAVHCGVGAVHGEPQLIPFAEKVPFLLVKDDKIVFKAGQRDGREAEVYEWAARVAYDAVLKEIKETRKATPKAVPVAQELDAVAGDGSEPSGVKKNGLGSTPRTALGRPAVKLPHLTAPKPHAQAMTATGQAKVIRVGVLSGPTSVRTLFESALAGAKIVGDSPVTTGF